MLIRIITKYFTKIIQKSCYKCPKMCLEISISWSLFGLYNQLLILCIVLFVIHCAASLACNNMSLHCIICRSFSVLQHQLVILIVVSFLLTRTTPQIRKSTMTNIHRQMMKAKSKSSAKIIQLYTSVHHIYTSVCPPPNFFWGCVSYSWFVKHGS